MQTNPDDPRVKLMQKWSQNMPQYGMQGASLGAKSGADDDDDEYDNDDAGSTRSAYSTYSSASALKSYIGDAKRAGKFSYILPASSNTQQKQHGQSAPPATAQGQSQTTHNHNDPNKKKKRKNKKGKKGKKGPKGPKGPKSFNVLVPANSKGWEIIQLSKANSPEKRFQALANINAKLRMIWEDLKAPEMLSKLDNRYDASTNVVTAIKNARNDFSSYDTAIVKLWGFQCALKKYHKQKYMTEPEVLPYDKNMQIYGTAEKYQSRMVALGMTQTQFNIYNKTKLVILFIKSLMHYETDKFTMPTETQLVEIKKKEKRVDKHHLMRKESDSAYNILHSMADALIPWIQIINKSVELEASKEKQGPRMSYPTKYGGVLVSPTTVTPVAPAPGPTYQFTEIDLD
jgi:hypothetical protein